MRRLCIFCFYDKYGVVDDYIPFFLRAFNEHCSEICVVVNGDMNLAGREKISPYITKLLFRENVGMDAAAYQYAIRHYGYEKLAEYDEVICANFTLFGPFCSIKNIFDDMSKKQCDWWSFFKWYIPTTNYNKQYRHIPSFFVAYRKSMLASKDFEEYWESLGDTSTYLLAVLNHEQRQTPYYDSRNFKSEVYIDDAFFYEYWDSHWPLVVADRLVIEKQFPFIKRRCFFVTDGMFDYASVIKRIIPYLKSHTAYDVNLIFNNIKRTQNLPKTRAQISKLKLLEWQIWSKFSPFKIKREKYRNKLINYRFTEKEFTQLFYKS